MSTVKDFTPTKETIRMSEHPFAAISTLIIRQEGAEIVVDVPVGYCAVSLQRGWPISRLDSLKPGGRYLIRSLGFHTPPPWAICNVLAEDVEAWLALDQATADRMLDRCALAAAQVGGSA